MHYIGLVGNYNPIITDVRIPEGKEGYNPYYLTLPNNDCFACVKECTNKGGSIIKENCPHQDYTTCPYNESGLFDD